MAKKDPHLVMKNYLNNHSLVESNVISFNNFIEKRMQEIINEVSDSVQSEDFEIDLGKVEVGKPRVIEADGSSSFITPTEARIRNITYSAPINLEITIKREGGQVDSEVVEIGKIPIMVKSNKCNTSDMSKEELINNFIDPKDPGGYFIVKGTERAMTMAEDLAENHAFIEDNKKTGLNLRILSSKGTY